MPMERQPARARAGRAATARRIASLASVVLLVAACQAQAAATPSPTATPRPTPAPTPTPLPGNALADTYRPEGTWLVTYALPGDFIRETWSILLTCPDGACDAVATIRDEDGAKLGKVDLTWTDGRWVVEAQRAGPVDCEAAGRNVRDGATATATTRLVLAGFPVAGTANLKRELHGTRTVVITPADGSGCEARTIVYPATGEPLADPS